MSLTWMGVDFHAGILLTAWGVGVYAYFLQCLFVRRALAHQGATVFGWLMGGALSAGTGMWAQSLLGLVAREVPFELHYTTAVVLAAWLPAVVLVMAVQWQFSVRGLDWRLRVTGGLFISVGLSMLGWVAQSSVVTAPSPSLSWGGLAAATGVFLLGSGVASVLTRKVLYQPGRLPRLLGISALVSTLFVLGSMIQMRALHIDPDAVPLNLNGLSDTAIYSLTTGIVMLLLVMAHLVTLYDESTLRKEAALRASLAQAQNALQDAAQHDPVTGLRNRLGFERALNQLLKADEGQTPLSLAVARLSLEGHKSIVESYGANVGDHFVRVLAGRLQAQMRPGDVLARGESDEFLVFGSGMTDDHQVTQWARRLGGLLHEPCLVEELELCLVTSIGIARFPDSASVEQLLSHSQDALLMARKAGGGAHCIYERGMDRHAHEQVAMQRDLRHAIERQELSLHFQPKILAQDGRLAGVEALLRWKHPVRGQVSPGEFIPVAERFGLISELGLWVLDAACRQIRQWEDAGLCIPVAVNLSAHQLRQPDLEARVRDALLRHRVQPSMLIMEITESTAMDDIEASLKVFEMLDAIGVSLSIDDFGTGYSSLSYLRRLPARQLKIDRSFVRDLESSPDARAIVEAVVRLAHALGLVVVAEGVETMGQAAILRELACDQFQGFFFARPMPETELIAWVCHNEVGVQAAVDAARLQASLPLAEVAEVLAEAPPLAPPPASEKPPSAWAHLEAQGS